MIDLGTRHRNIGSPYLRFVFDYMDVEDFWKRIFYDAIL